MSNGLRVRQRADRLSPNSAAEIRRAYKGLQDISAQSAFDERGYNHLAGIHGFPLEIYCQHGNLLFLPWHRAYLYFFEMALNDVAPGVSVPWWDWGRRQGHDAGLPDIFADRQVEGEANPLYDAPVMLPPEYIAWLRDNLAGTISDDPEPRTVRDLDPVTDLPPQTAIDDILTAPTFEDFSNRLEFGPHGSVHVWVGGTMSQVPTAGFDPVFWSHHSAIDRLWYLWQISDAGMDPPRAILNTVLRPFNMTVRDTLNINTLGYEYAVTVTS